MYQVKIKITNPDKVLDWLAERNATVTAKLDSVVYCEVSNKPKNARVSSTYGKTTYTIKV